MSEKAKKRCFVVSPIGIDGSQERRHADMLLHGIISPVLSGEFDVRRADGFPSPDIITARIIDCIVNWDLVIADLSFTNANVFYEIGLRHMVSKPIIHMAATDTKLPFDTASQRTIFFDPFDWHSQEKTRGALKASVEEILKPDYSVSNPVTHALGIINARVDADPQSKLVASLEERLARMENQLRPTLSEAQSLTAKRLEMFWSFIRSFQRNGRRISVDSIVQFVNDQLLGLSREEAQQLFDAMPRNLDAKTRDIVASYLYEKHDVLPF